LEGDLDGDLEGDLEEDLEGDFVGDFVDEVRGAEKEFRGDRELSNCSECFSSFSLSLSFLKMWAS
jgi:hypothetical protein